MPRNKLEDVRNHMFETLEKLQDGDITPDQANAMARVGQTIVNTAKLEYRCLKDMYGDVSRSSFIQIDNPEDRKAIEGETKDAAQ